VQPGLDDFPLFFNEDERSWLEGSPFIAFVDDEIENTRYDYDLIVKELPEIGQLYTYRQYAEAKFLVTSRNFGVTIDGKDTNI
jgi:protein-histidine N-methyltransferase